jgi:hypothetical protein
MIRLRFNRSRSPSQNLLWSLRHAGYLAVFLVLALLGGKHDTTLDQLVFAAILIGIICNIAYCIGYLVAAGFWAASSKYPRISSLYAEYFPTIEDLELWYQEALGEFRNTRITSPPAQIEFDGSDAEIVKIEKSGESDRPEKSLFTVTIYARSPAGEYFIFKKTSSSKPYFKHIAKSVAEKVLKLDNATHNIESTP